MEAFLNALAPVWKPHPGQRAFLLSQAKTKVLACGRRWGKTDVCAIQTLEAVSHRGPPTKHFLIAPTLRQARILFDRFVELLRRSASTIDLPIEGEIKPKLAPVPSVTVGEHVVTARSGHLLYALRGFEATHIVVDEAAYVPDALVHDVLNPMLATTDGSMTLISTPNGRNGFWRMFMRGQDPNSGIWSRQSPTQENPMVPERFLLNQRETTTERTYAVEYEAQFEESDGAVFRQETIDAAFGSWAKEDANGPTYIGVDLGRKMDYTAVAVLQGTREAVWLVQFERFHEIAWSLQVKRIVEIVNSYPNAVVMIDGMGVGDRILEDLREALPNTPVEAYKFTNDSKGRLINDLKWLFEREHLHLRPEPVLRSELEDFRVEGSKSGLPRYGTQSGHDDCVIALALAAVNLPATSTFGIVRGATRN